MAKGAGGTAEHAEGVKLKVETLSEIGLQQHNKPRSEHTGPAIVAGSKTLGNKNKHSEDHHH